jgi:hypothetical protein
MHGTAKTSFTTKCGALPTTGACGRAVQLSTQRRCPPGNWLQSTASLTSEPQCLTCDGFRDVVASQRLLAIARRVLRLRPVPFVRSARAFQGRIGSLDQSVFRGALLAVVILFHQYHLVLSAYRDASLGLAPRERLLAHRLSRWAVANNYLDPSWFDRLALCRLPVFTAGCDIRCLPAACSSS